MEAISCKLIRFACILGTGCGRPFLPEAMGTSKVFPVSEIAAPALRHPQRMSL